MPDIVVIGGVFREILDGDTTPRPRLGGSGLTSAIIAAQLGAKVTLVSYVGKEDSETAHHLLEAAGVDRRSILTVPGSSGTYVFPTELQGRSLPWPMYRPAESLPSASPSIPEAKLYVVFGIPDLDPIAMGWLDHLPAESILLWDRQGWISRARDSRGAAKLPPRQKIYLANIAEVREEFTASDEAASIGHLPPSGFQGAIVKRGDNGCILIDTTSREWTRKQIDAFPVHGTSTIGSGDAFAGALAASLIHGRTVETAVRMSNAVAAAFLRAMGDPLADGLVEAALALMEQASELP